jgi:predicted nucleic acid-binding protein
MAGTGPQKREYVVDTNVLAYFALATPPFHEDVSTLFREPIELIAPESWHAEFLHVVWQAIRFQGIAACHGLELLEEVDRVVNHSVPVGSLWREALTASLEHDLNTYDALFLVLAEREHLELLTYDRRLLSAFPDIAKRPGTAAAG